MPYDEIVMVHICLRARSLAGVGSPRGSDPHAGAVDFSAERIIKSEQSPFLFELPRRLDRANPPMEVQPSANDMRMKEGYR